MKEHEVRVHRSDAVFPREAELAWQLARVATEDVPVEADVAEMVVNRVLDNAAVSAASLLRAPVVAARAQALAHPPSRGGSGARVVGTRENATALLRQGV